jgi:transposase
LAPYHQDRGAGRVRRYPSDTTDAQWAVIDRLLPDPAWLAGKGGRLEVHCRRAVVDAIFYLVGNGITWQALPADFPPWSTVYNYLAAWEAAGVTQDVLDGLRDRVRLASNHAAVPSAAVIDSQSGKAAETVGAASRGYDAGKKINGRKRPVAVDTLGLLLCVLVTAASVQDCDGARPLLDQLAASCPGSGWSGPTAATPANSSTGPAPHARSPCRSSNAPRTPPGSPSSPTLGRRTNPGLDHLAPAMRPRPRTPAPTPRDQDPLVHDPPHQPTSRQTRLGTGSKSRSLVGPSLLSKSCTQS